MNMEKFIKLILILAWCLSGHRCTEIEDSSKVDLILSVILFHWRNIEKSNYSISCDGIVEVNGFCMHYALNQFILDIQANDGRDASIILYSDDGHTKHFSGLITKEILIDSTLNPIITIQNSGDNIKLIDIWNSISTLNIGLYEFNEAPGFYDKREIGIKLNLKPVYPKKPYATLIISISYMHIINNKNINNNFCRERINGKHFNKRCFLNVFVSINNARVWTSESFEYFISNPNYKIGLVGGTSSKEIKMKNIDVTVGIAYILDSEIIIDQAKISKINLSDGDRNLIVNNVSGESNYVVLNAQIKYDCNGYVGINCEFECRKIDEVTSCSSIDGNRYCLNGAKDVPTCSLSQDFCKNIICQNEGTCINDTNKYYCNCLKGFTGPNCEINLCDKECFRGVCDKDGKCVCIPEYEGIFCEISMCSNKEMQMCKNGGQCFKIRNKVQCTCPSYATGPTCAILKCNPSCIRGMCSYKVNSSSKVECVCDKNYTGIACDIPNLTAVIFEIGIYTYILVVLIFLFLISLKFLTGFILRKIFGIVQIFVPKVFFSKVESETVSYGF